MNTNDSAFQSFTPWNQGKVVGQKAPLKLKDIWEIRVHLQIEKRARELALVNLAVDSKLCGCDLVALRVRDVCHDDALASRTSVVQQKTGHPVQFEITAATREALAVTASWIKAEGLRGDGCLLPSRNHASPHLGARQYARIVHGWVDEIGLDGHTYGTHSMRRTKATLNYRKTKNLRATQLLQAHTKLESMVRYLGIEVEDALDIAEQTEI